MVGPPLQTSELESWAKSRGLSDADTAQLRAVFEERDRLGYALEGIAFEFERTVDHVDHRGKGGQQVPFHGDFASACQLPSFVAKARWWARHLRDAITGSQK